MARTRKLDVAASVHGADQEKATAPVPVPEGRRAHPRSSRPKTREGKKGVLIYVLPEMSQQLRQLALGDGRGLRAERVRHAVTPPLTTLGPTLLSHLPSALIAQPRRREGQLARVNDANRSLDAVRAFTLGASNAKRRRNLTRYGVDVR